MTDAVRASGLRKVYGQHEAVAGIDLAIGCGQIVAFLGPNGAGKTTTLKMLTGLLTPTAGSAAIMGLDITTQPREAKARLGWVPDSPNLYLKLKGREYLEFIASLYRVDPAVANERAGELLRMFALEDAAGDLIESYSHGMRQKMALAGALLHDPDVLFLDEPMVGLDPRSARLIKDMLGQLRDRGTTVIFSTHILEIAERMCDAVVIIDRGRVIAQGSMDELRARSGGSLEDIFLSLTGGAEYAELASALVE